MRRRLMVFALVTAVVACADAQGPRVLAVEATSSSVSAVTVSPDTLRLEVGDTGLVACRPVNRYGAALADRCTWAIRSTTVASVRASGQSAKVTAKLAGQSWAVGTVKGKRDSALVIVHGATPFPDSVPPLPDSTPPKPPVDTTGPLAAAADSFVGSMSVQTHLGYTGGVYDTKWASVIRPRLLELGIRHVRERMGTNAMVIARFQDLAANGVKLTAGCWAENGDYTNAAHCLTKANTHGTGTIDAFDGQNEMEQLGTGWQTKFATWQAAQWNAYKGSGTWKDRPLFANTLAHYQSAASVGDQSAHLDFGNLHSYPCGVNASCLPSNVSAWITAWNAIDGAKPVVATETGIHTCPSCEGIGMSVAAQGKLAGRLWFEYWNAKVYRTSFYELIDQGVSTTDREKNWGLLTNDGSPKPSFMVTKNLIALLSDAGPAVTPGRLNYTLANATTAVHATLLQKRDGRFYLALWQEVPVWNASAKADVTNADRPVTLTLGTPAGVQVYRPATNAWTDLGRGGSFTLGVPDEVIVVEVTR